MHDKHQIRKQRMCGLFFLSFFRSFLLFFFRSVVLYFRVLSCHRGSGTRRPPSMMQACCCCFVVVVVVVVLQRVRTRTGHAHACIILYHSCVFRNHVRTYNNSSSSWRLGACACLASRMQSACQLTEHGAIECLAEERSRLHLLSLVVGCCAPANHIRLAVYIIW